MLLVHCFRLLTCQRQHLVCEPVQLCCRYCLQHIPIWQPGIMSSYQHVTVASLLPCLRPVSQRGAASPSQLHYKPSTAMPVNLRSSHTATCKVCNLGLRACRCLVDKTNGITGWQLGAHRLCLKLKEWAVFHNPSATRTKSSADCYLLSKRLSMT